MRMSNRRKRHTITVGELKQHLSVFSNSDELDFGGLEFYRTKSRGPGLVKIEFAQNVYVDDQDMVVVENFEDSSET